MPGFNGLRLKYLRHKKGLTQGQVAAELVMKFLKYQRMEVYTNPTPDDLVKIALFHGVSADWILGLKPPEGPLPHNIDDDEPGFKGSRLKLLRKLKDVLQPEAAACMGMTATKLSYFERERFPPAPDDLINIAQYFEVSINWLLVLPHQLDGVVPEGLEDLDWPKVIERAEAMGLGPDDVMMSVEFMLEH